MIKKRIKTYFEFLTFGRFNSWDLIHGLLLFLYILAIIITYLQSYWFIRKHSFVWVSIFIVPLFFFIIIKQFLYWKKNKYKLLIIENFLILFLFGIYFSVIFGYIDYSLYIQNNDNFRINKSMYNDIKSEKINKFENEIKEVNGLIVKLDDIYKNIAKKEYLKYDSITRLWNLHKLNITIKYKYIPPNGGLFPTPPLSCIIVRQNNFRHLFNNNIHKEIGWFSSYDNQIDYTQKFKTILLNEIDDKCKLKEVIESKILGYEVPVGIFLYSKISQSLNHDMGFYSPNNILTRISEFIFLVIRFIYYGFIIFFFIDILKSKKT